MFEKCLIIGCGSHASSVISIIESANDKYSVYGLVDTANNYDSKEKKSGYKVITSLKLLLENSDKYVDFHCVVAIGDNYERFSVFDKLQKAGFCLPNIVSSHAFIDRTVVMGIGNVIAHGAIINAQTILGDNNIVNTSAVIEHGSVLNNHIHVAPRATLCGGVKIESLTLIGASATIIPNLKVSYGSTIGAGAVLTQSISAANLIYIGIPARVKN